MYVFLFLAFLLVAIALVSSDNLENLNIERDAKLSAVSFISQN